MYQKYENAERVGHNIDGVAKNGVNDIDAVLK